MLIKIDTQTLEQTQQLLRDSTFSLSHLEKWAIAQSALLYQQEGLIDLNKLDTSIKQLNKLEINTLFNQADIDWLEAMRKKTNNANMTMNVDLECTCNYGEDDVHFMARFTGGGDGINIKPLTRLSNTDALAVAMAISEIKKLYIDAPTSQSLEGYGSMYEEVLELFQEWLPSQLENAPESRIQTYFDKHAISFYAFMGNDDMHGEYEDIVVDYVERRDPTPDWFEAIDRGIGDKRPWLALKRLENVSQRVQDTRAKRFVESVITKTHDFLCHFDSNQTWTAFISGFDSHLHFLETDNPHIELAYMLVWGNDGYWWGVCSDIHTMMMDAGEVPSHYHPAEGAIHRRELPLVYERLCIGDALLMELAELSMSLEEDTRQVA